MNAEMHLVDIEMEYGEDLQGYDDVNLEAVIE